jgi:hypothetical protein
LTVWAEHDGQVDPGQCKPLEQSSRAGVRIRVEAPVRMAIARQKTFQPKHIPVSLLTHDDGTAHALLQ